MNRFLLFLVVLFVMSCTKENFIDTGLANGNHDCSMLEYMKKNLRDWDSTVVMIEHSGLKEMFDGKDKDSPTITFLGVTTLSILRYMEINEIQQIADMDPQACRKFLLQYVLSDKLKKEDIPVGTKGLSMPPPRPFVPGTGGVKLMTEGGKNVRFFTMASDYGGVAGAGPVYLYLEARSTTYDIASADIQFTNGVIHSLHYNHTLGEL